MRQRGWMRMPGRLSSRQLQKLLLLLLLVVVVMAQAAREQRLLTTSQWRTAEADGHTTVTAGARAQRQAGRAVAGAECLLLQSE